MADRKPRPGWQLGRTLVHRHRLPSRLLPQVSPLSSLLPAHGTGPLSAAYLKFVTVGFSWECGHVDHRGITTSTAAKRVTTLSRFSDRSRKTSCTNTKRISHRYRVCIR